MMPASDLQAARTITRQATRAGASFEEEKKKKDLGSTCLDSGAASLPKILLLVY
jgi:cob(I)alamin adenosyltransferase